MPKIKILIIDDEVDFGKLVKLTLEAGGDFEVSIATDGMNGLAEAQKKPDLILLDIRMAGMDGIEVLKRLRKDKNTINIPVVMLTAIGYKPFQVRAEELYAEEYITKPIEAFDLKVKINEVLKNRGSGH
ncbi:MAG: response regulator [Candidatus Omnitrophota bacterium]